MAKILLIETSTAKTSVALSLGGSVVFYVDDDSTRNQSSLTAPFIKQALDSQGLKAKDLDAVCVSMGPGSYTGLRVGVSSAKGLCFGAGIPLIGVGTLDCLVWEVLSEDSQPANEYKYIVPVLDARRMEVYTALFGGNGNKISEVSSQIIDSHSFDTLLADAASDGQRVLFVGDAAEKCSTVITASNARFLQRNPSAKGLQTPAIAAYQAGEFRDVAYFEPFYLKDFVATVSRKKLF